MLRIHPRVAAREAELRVLRVRERLSSRVHTLATAARVRLGIRGVRGPGEGVPPRGLAAYYDYRDILSVEQVPEGYRNGAFGLGDAFDLRLGHRGRIALPADVLRHHVAIVGPRRHETRRYLLAPWIASALELDWSVLGLDADGRLDDIVNVEIVESAIGRSGARVRLDTTQPAASSSWNWLTDLDTATIDAAVRALVGLNDDSSFAGPARDARVLRGMLELTRDGIISADGEQLVATLTSHAAFRAAAEHDRHSDGGARLHDLTAARSSNFRSTVGGARARLRRLERRVAGLRGRPPLRLDQVLATPQLLSVVARQRDGATGRVLAGLITATLLERAFRRSPGSVRQLVVVVEDARTLLPGVDLAELLDVAADAGVSFVLCTPTTSAYGPQVAEVLDQCGTIIATSGCSPQSARFMSDRIAKRGNKLGHREIIRPPFPGRIATVDSDLIADRPFLVDISA